MVRVDALTASTDALIVFISPWMVLVCASAVGASGTLNIAAISPAETFVMVDLLGRHLVAGPCMKAT